MSENIKDPDDNPKDNGVWEKKSERFEVRLPFSKKQAFLEACEGQGDTPSEAIRRFIQIYLKRSQEDNLDLARRSLKHKRRQKLSFGLTGILAISAMSIVGPQGCASIKAHQLEAQRQSLFAVYDKDGDEQLRLGEVAANDDALHKVLDVDDSNSITLQEFVTAGRMQVMPSFKGRGTKSPLRESNNLRQLVEFNLSDPENIILNAWKVDPDFFSVSDKMDRMIWRDFQTGKIGGVFAETTLIFNNDGDTEFDEIVIDWGKSKTLYGNSFFDKSKSSSEGN